MNHHAAPEFWERYHELPAEVQRLADRAFETLRADSRHPSLHLKRVKWYWTARVGLHHRAVAVDATDGLLWFWIGSHADYDKLIG